MRNPSTDSTLLGHKQEENSSNGGSLNVVASGPAEGIVELQLTPQNFAEFLTKIKLGSMLPAKLNSDSNTIDILSL